MKISSPLVLGFDNINAFEKALKDRQYEIEGAYDFLTKGGPAVKYLKALAGYKSRVIVAKLPENPKGIKSAVKSYLPRELSGLFDGCEILAKDSDIVVVKLYRK